MVLDNGHIVEYDSPSTLLALPHGVFYGMAKDAGLVTNGHNGGRGSVEKDDVSPSMIKGVQSGVDA